MEHKPRPFEQTWDLVYDWASKKRAEDDSNAYFHWTQTAKRLLFKLQNESKAYIGLLGLSGIGKSHTLYAIEKVIQKDLDKQNLEEYNNDRLREELEPVLNLPFGLSPYQLLHYKLSFKWSSSESLWGMLQTDNEAKERLDGHYRGNPYRKRVYEAYFNTDRGRRMIEAVGHKLERMRMYSPEKALEEAKDWVERDPGAALDSIADFNQIEGRVKVNVREKIKDDLVFELLSNAEFILIDFPDYGHADVRLLNRDLTQIGALWSKLRADGSASKIVVSIQKELLEKGGEHFTVRKMDLLTIDPFKAEELVTIYKEQFQTSEPFIEDSLTLIASLSRGIYRRFKKYIQACLESVAEKRLVTVEDVKACITEEQLVKDMELELFGLFKNVEQRRQAIQILNHLREASLNQKEVAEFLGVSMMTASRIISRLQAYGYIKRERGEGKEWIVSLKL